MRAITILLLALLAPRLAQATDCPAPNAAQPLRPSVVVPVASELAWGATQLGTANGVLSQAYDESQSLDQVLLRQRIESCHNVANAMPAAGVVSPDNPAAYKPKTQFDNTPWRFNMTQNGKQMTADEFSAWMKARGVRVAKGANAGAADAGQLPAPPVQSPVPGSPQPAPAPQQTPEQVPATPPKPE